MKQKTTDEYIATGLYRRAETPREWLWYWLCAPSRLFWRKVDDESVLGRFVIRIEEALGALLAWFFWLALSILLVVGLPAAIWGILWILTNGFAGPTAEPGCGAPGIDCG